jgi:hypothetical protein
MKHFVLIFFFFAVISCITPQRQIDVLIRQNDSLRGELLRQKDVLDSCLVELEQYKNTPDKLYAQVEDLVKRQDVIGLLTICQSLEKYHPSSVECKKAKLALDNLNSEMARQAAAEKAKRLQAVNKLKKDFDDVSGITWYYNPYFVHYNNSTHVSVYIGKKSTSAPWLRLKMSYYGNNWIFFENAYLSYDGTTISIPFDKYQEKKTDHYTDCWEWIDVSVSDTLLSFLQQMIKGKVVKSRFDGKYTSTHILTKQEIKGIEDVLLAYDVLLKEKR